MMKTLMIYISLLLPSLAFAGESNAQFTLNIFFTNDIHGGIVEQSAEFLNPEFPPILGGGASAMAIVKQARKGFEVSGETSLFIDAGDIFQGTLVGTLSKGKTMIEYMNMAGYDACCPGNHDFDLGKDNLIELIKMSKFPWISCNIVDKSSGELWYPLKRYMIKEIRGVKIGFTGATTVGTEYMSFPENIKGLHFIPEIPALQKTVDILRNEEKIDLIIAMVHTGLPYNRREGYEKLQQTSYEDVIERGYAGAMEIAHFVRGIDILLGGHLHLGYQEPWVDPVNHTICLQNYGNGGNLGWLKVDIDPTTNSIVNYRYPSDRGTLLLLQEDQFWPDSLVAAYIHSQQKIYEAGFREVIGSTQTALTRAGVGESPMYNLVTDAMRTRVKADFSFTNYGGIRADIKVGPITREQIFKVLPFGNQVVEFQVDGRFLKKVVEEKIKGNRRGMAISAAKIVYNSTRPDGDKITEFLLGGQPLQANKMYRVATTDYLMEGNSGLSILKQIPDEKIAYTGILLREAVIEYVQKYSPLKIELEGRWEKNDKSEPDPDWVKQFQTSQVSIEK